MITGGKIILDAPIKVKDLAKLIGYNFLKYKDYEIIWRESVPACIPGHHYGGAGEILYLGRTTATRTQTFETITESI